MIELLQDLWRFFKQRKKWWLMPLMIVLALIGVILVFGGSSSLAPFIYSLF